MVNFKTRVKRFRSIISKRKKKKQAPKKKPILRRHVTIPRHLVKGPVRPTTDVKVFRRTGRSIIKQPKDPRVKVLRVTRRGTPASRVAPKVKKITKHINKRVKVIEPIKRKAKVKRVMKRIKKPTLSPEERRQRAIQRQHKTLKKLREFEETPTRRAIEKRGRIVLETPKRKTFLERNREKIRKLEIEIARAKPSEKFKLKRELEIAKLTSAEIGISTLIGIASIPGAIKKLPSNIAKIVKDPKSLKQVPSRFKRGAVDFGQTIKTSPTRALVKVGGEILMLKGTGKAVEVVGSLSKNAVTRISPKFRGIKKQSIIIPSAQKGKTIKIGIGGTVKTLREPLKKQVALAGKEVTSVTAQADRLVNLIKTKRVIRKPIPNEHLLSKNTKKLLSNFDEGKIKKTELPKLMTKVKKETGESLLERSLFADPRGRLRPSRLGRKQKEASLLDILAGDVTFKSQKPQVLIFEKTKVEALPKTKQFKQIKRKLKSNKALTKAEAKDLLKFQLKKSGKLKPVGALSTEPEVTLAPGEILKKEKIVAKTIIDGKVVPIVRVKIIKPKKTTQELIKKSKIGKITTKELRELEKRLEKETGFKTALSRKAFKPKPRVRVPKRVPRKVKKIVRKDRRIIRKKKKVKRKVRIRKKPSISIIKKVSRKKPRVKKPSRKPIARPVTKPPIRRPPIRIKKVPKRIPIPLKKKKKKKRIVKKKKVTKAYNVFARPTKKIKGKRRRLIKVNKVPLTKIQAKNLGSYVVDKSLSRTYKIKKITGIKPKKPRLKVPAKHYQRTKKKFRNYKIVKGRRVPLKSKAIERRRSLLDTKSEKKGITLRRKIKQLGKKSKIKRKKVKGDRKK